MKCFLFTLLLFFKLITCIPTKTIYALQTATVSESTPTPVLIKRDVQDDLELYQNWASMCRNRDHIKAAAVVNTSDINHLWKTVTQTINCGGGTAVTVTTTITTSPTSQPEPSSNDCTGQCWSDYLWHTYGDGISPAQGFVGTLCVIVGLYFAIFGYRFFRPTLGLVGFVFFATMTWIGLVNNEPAGGYPLGDVIYICVSAGLGILGAIILVFLYPLGVYCLACLGGFYVAVYILSWKEDLVITMKVARVCFIIGLSLLGPIVLYFVETYMVIFSTSLMGAYLFHFGLDFFAHTGFINPWLLIFDGNPNHHNVYLISKPIHVMLAFVIVGTIVFIVWQYYWNIICLKSPGFGLNPPVEEEQEEPKKEEKKEQPPANFMCMPPPYYSTQPMIMQQVCAPPYQPHC